MQESLRSYGAVTLSQKGTKVRGLRANTWPGITHVAIDVRYPESSGLLSLHFSAPALCTVEREIGGRCQFRHEPSTPADSGYYGDGHISFIRRGASAHLHSAGMHSARVDCFLFSDKFFDGLEDQQRHAALSANSRYMFADKRLRMCMTLLLHDNSEGSATSGYRTRLIRALATAFAEFFSNSPDGPEVPGPISSTTFGAVISAIRGWVGSDVRIAELVAIAGVPEPVLRREFLRMTGMTIRRWQMDARVRTAGRLMLEMPESRLEDIASLAGFANQSHLSRAFRTVFGMLPSAWLRVHRQRSSTRLASGRDSGATRQGTGRSFS